MIEIRPAAPGDIAAIHTLLAPFIAKGQVLPKEVTHDAFLVAFDGDTMVGSVALTPLDHAVAELGSLVSTRRGQGLGRRLVDEVTKRAAAEGFELVVALTAEPSFFENVGFKPTSISPWMSARRALNMPHPLPMRVDDHALRAAQAKSSACQRCPRLITCHQVQMLHVIPQSQRRLG